MMLLTVKSVVKLSTFYKYYEGKESQNIKAQFNLIDDKVVIRKNGEKNFK